jgi:hypothetical protein
LAADAPKELPDLVGALGCVDGAGFAGAVSAGCVGAGVGLAEAPAAVDGVTAGAEFEEPAVGTEFAALGAPDAVAAAADGVEVLAEGCAAVVFAGEFAVGAELELEAGAVAAELGGPADPAGVFTEFVGADALVFAPGEGSGSVFAGTCAAGLGAGFRKGSP